MARTPQRLILPASDSCELLNRASPEQVVATIRSAQRSNVDLYGKVSPPQFGNTDMWETANKAPDGRPLIVVVQTIGQLIFLEPSEGKKARREMMRIWQGVTYQELAEKEKTEGRSFIGTPHKTQASKNIEKYGDAYGGEK